MNYLVVLPNLGEQVCGCTHAVTRRAVIRIEPGPDASPAAREAGTLHLCHEHACFLVPEEYKALCVMMSGD